MRPSFNRALTGAALLALVFGIAGAFCPAAAQPTATLERQARDLFDQEKYRESVDAFQRLLSADPGNRTGNVLLPFALARLESHDAAIAQARRSLERFPDDIGLQLLLAGLLGLQDATRNE